MSSFPLQTNTRSQLSDHDLRMLKDYALQAPWEWRMAFDELINCTEQHYDSDDFIDRIDMLEAEQARAVKTIRLKLEVLGKAFTTRKVDRGHIEDVLTGVRAALVELEEQTLTKTEETKTP